MISAYLIVVLAFVIVGTYIGVVRQFLNESELESTPTRPPAEPTETPPVGLLSFGDRQI